MAIVVAVGLPAAAVAVRAQSASFAPADGQIVDGTLETAVEPADAAVEPQAPADGDLGDDGNLAVALDPNAVPIDDAGVGLADQQAADAAMLVDAPDAGRPDAKLRELNDEAADPFAPIGLRSGSFLFNPAVSADVVATDNVRQLSTDRSSDIVVEVRPSLAIQSDWEVHGLEASIDANSRLHRTFESDDATDWNALLRGRIDISRLTSIEAEASYALAEDPRSEINVPDAALTPAAVATQLLAARLNHRFNRLALQFELSRIGTEHSALDLADGSIDLRSDEDTTVVGGRLRASYEWIDGYEAFIEHARDRTIYAAASEADGIRRDGDGEVSRIGLKATISPIYEGEASIGYRTFDPDDERLSAIAGIVVDASLTYRPTDHTRIGVKAASNIEATSIAGAAGALSQDFAIDVRHELTRRFVVVAGLGLGLKSYQGIDAAGQDHAASFGLEYLLNRNWALTGGYQHLTSDIEGDGEGSVAENRLRFGVRWQQ